MVKAHNDIGTVNLAARDNYRFSAKVAHGIDQCTGRLGSELALHRRLGKQARLSIVGHRAVRALNQAAHQTDRGLRYAGIQLAVVCHDGVDEHLGARLGTTMAEI